MLSFAITIFVSAFLLFQIQPLISRYILPWFGGSPAVWSASMLFFQILLLGGYGYAHWVARRRGKGVLVHAALLGASLLILLVSTLFWGVPLLPGQAWKPPDPNFPLVRIIAVLLVSVGFPYFILSSTSPLLQAWWGRLFPGRQPYRLYALSNFGSLLALVSYPFVFEPLLRLSSQARLWSAAYLLFAGLCGFVALQARRVQEDGFPDQKSTAAKLDYSQPHDDQGLGEGLIPSTSILPSQGASSAGIVVMPARSSHLSKQLLWISLSACTSILLLSITNQLSQEVAVIPFLWVLPLSLYLLSFIIAFSGEGWYRRGAAVIVLGLATLLLAYVLYEYESVGVVPQILIYSLFLLCACLVLHAELYRSRPEAGQLTVFYFLVSLGGAIGGLFVNLIAPLIFRGYWELQVGVLLCWLLLVLILLFDRQPSFRRRSVWVSAPFSLLLVGLVGFSFYSKIDTTVRGALEMQRNFYGVFRVRSILVGEPPRKAFTLTHGITSHGLQFEDRALRAVPTSYYGRSSGIGLAIDSFRSSNVGSRPTAGLKVGVIGLGVGTLAAYGESGDIFRFYEINPDIIQVAQGEGGYFSYLGDTRAALQIVPGDARLSLEAELDRGERQGFDILAVDAFSGDSIPVHLLTAEALGIYLEHLQPQGLLAMHISNRYLDLTSVAREAANLHNLGLALIHGPRDNSGSYASTWALFSRDRAVLARPLIASKAGDLPELGAIRPWTDDYSNLFQVLNLNPSSFWSVPALSWP